MSNLIQFSIHNLSSFFFLLFLVLKQFLYNSGVFIIAVPFCQATSDSLN